MASFSLLYWSHFSSCSDSDDGESFEDSGAGAISGQVFLHDPFGIPTDNEGMTIRLVGHGSTATSEVNGAYVFTSAPLGTYEMIFEKDGFGTFITEVEHTRSFERGSTTVLAYYLGEKSSTFVGGSGATSMANDRLQVQLSTLPTGTATGPIYLSVFLGRDANITNQSNLGVIGPLRINTGFSNVSLEIAIAQVQDLGFTSGETVHFKIYGDSFHTNAYEGDNGTVHPNANDRTNQFVSGSFVLP